MFEIARITDFIHIIIENFFEDPKELIAIDATVGNGYDTIFLAKRFKYVYGFDIQDKAIENTKQRLENNNLKNYKLFKVSHEFLDLYVEKADLIVFNLGYLPGADKNLTTNYKTTLKALESSLKILSYLGIVLLTSYRGHSQGQEEYLYLKKFIESLDSKIYKAIEISYINSPNLPPIIFVIQKIKKGV